METINKESFTSVDFINLLIEGKSVEAEHMFRQMMESEVEQKIEECIAANITKFFSDEVNEAAVPLTSPIHTTYHLIGKDGKIREHLGNKPADAIGFNRIEVNTYKNNNGVHRTHVSYIGKDNKQVSSFAYDHKTGSGPSPTAVHGKPTNMSPIASAALDNHLSTLKRS